MHRKTLAPADSTDTEAPPPLAPPTHWPPRILRARAQWWMRLRDLVATFLAWMAYLWFLRKPVVACIAWLSPSTGAYLAQVIDLGMVIDLRPYLWFAGGLLLWLFLSGLHQRRRLQQQPGPDHEVPALTSEAQFAAAGVPVSEQRAWREPRCVRVHFDEGRFTRVTAARVGQ